MTEQQARERGFTVPIFASSSMYDLELLTQPDTDLDGTFEAYDLAEGEMLDVNGWLFSIEREEA